MPIQALPSSATRVLGSCQALTTPASLVKELIDNAIDAKATSIDVILAPNTLDKIEVRDNGHGIPTEDLDALGRSGHTSKLKTFEELKTVSRFSLGFRGEALASAVTLGNVTVTTRTEGEPVAVLVKLKPTGGVASQSSVSHPVGTTVCVSNFLSSFPVRKQTSLKDAPKAISRIKTILQSYALARLNVRLNLKILKTGKGNWSFVPRPKDGIREMVMQIAGKEVASQCAEKTISSDGDTVMGFTSYLPAGPRSSLVIRVFLPRADADLSKVKGGQFASIDSRPVSCSRGFLKNIITSYKQHVRELAGTTGHDIPRDLFLYLSITCSHDSYDANVEPAKDDVLFEDEKALLLLADELFKSIYTLPSHQKPGANEQSASPRQVPAVTDQAEALDGGKVASASIFNARPNSSGRSEGNEDSSDMILDDSVSPPEASRRNNQNTLNPWLITKLNTPAKEPHAPIVSTPRRQSSSTAHMLNTPPASGYQQLNTRETPSYSNERRPTRSSGPQPLQRSMEEWTNPPPRFPPLSPEAQYEDAEPQQMPELLEVESPVRNASKDPRPAGFVSAASVPLGTPWSPPLTQKKPPSRGAGRFNKPFAPLKRVADQTNIEHGGGRQPSPSSPPFRPVQGSPRLPVPRDDNVEDALEYERRKATATRRLREDVRMDLTRDGQDQPPNQEDQRTANTDVGAQSSIRQETLQPATIARSVLRDGDPRAYLMRRQKSMAASANAPLQGTKIKRTKTMMLPLETTPASAGTHKLVLRMPFDSATVAKSIREFSGNDEYVRSGTRYEGLRLEGPDCEHVEALLNGLMRK